MQIRRLSFALLAVALVACDSDSDDADGGRDSGTVTDGGSRRDSGPPPDGGPRDGGSPRCTEGCEFVELALGGGHSCARRANGEVYCWGRDLEGQLGDGTRRPRFTCGVASGVPINCGGPSQVVQSGVSDAPLLDAVQISSEGGANTCATRENGEVVCWGLQPVLRVQGALRQYLEGPERIGDVLGELVQVSNASNYVCVIRDEDNGLACFGENYSGRLGLGDAEYRYVLDETVLVRSPTDATMRFTGVDEVRAHPAGTTCARSGGRLFCWGNGTNEQLASNTTSLCQPAMGTSFKCRLSPDAVLGPDGEPLEGVAAFDVGGGHVCARTSAGALHCWGDNRAGQIGLAPPASNLDRAAPLAVAGVSGAIDEVAVGDAFTCARSGGSVWCWGFNERGQLGDGMSSHGRVCDLSGEVSGDCTHTPVQVSGLTNVRTIAAGSSHACAILTNNQIWCWGDNTTRQLGDASIETRYAPVQVRGLPD